MTTETASFAPESLPPEINPDAPASITEDAFTLARAVDSYSRDGMPRLLRRVVQGTATTVRAYATAQITLIQPGCMGEISEARKVEASVLDTGEITVSIDELLDEEPTPKSSTTSLAPTTAAAKSAAHDEYRLERQHALKTGSLSLRPTQALVADIALRRLAGQGDPAAHDILSRHPDILTPSSRVGRVLMIPLSLLALTPYSLKG